MGPLGKESSTREHGVLQLFQSSCDCEEVSLTHTCPRVGFTRCSPDLAGVTMYSLVLHPTSPAWVNRPDPRHSYKVRGSYVRTGMHR